MIGRSDLAAPAALFAIVVAVYATSMVNGFVYDDHEVLLAQPPLGSAADLARIFAEPHGLPLSGLPYYRAVTRASLLVQKTLHGDVAALFHLGNALLMGVAAVGAWWLLRFPRFGLPPAAALLAAAAFALHPVASSCVHPIASGRETLMVGVFWLFAVGAQLRGGLAGRAAAALLLGCALLSKEQALALPGVLVGADALRLSRDPPTTLRTWLFAVAPIAIVVALYFALRAAVFPPDPSGTPPWTVVAGSLTQNPAGPVWAILYALQSVFAPRAGLVYEPALEVWLSWPRLLWAAAGLCAVVALCLRRPRRDLPVLVFWLAWIPVCMATTLNLVPLEVAFAERFVFVSSLGPVALAAAGLAGLAGPSRTLRARRAVVALGVAVIAVLTILSIGRGRFYRDDVAFARQWVRTSPRHANAHSTLGTVLLERGQDLEAMAVLREAVRLDPGHATARYNLAVALSERGELGEAALEFERSLAAYADNPDAHYALGVLRALEGSNGAARRHLQEALRLRPGFREAREALAGLPR
ncbi:MAG: tetratricopeptide repeat protein [Myxococcota bacterium]